MDNDSETLNISDDGSAGEIDAANLTAKQIERGDYVDPGAARTTATDGDEDEVNEGAQADGQKGDAPAVEAPDTRPVRGIPKVRFDEVNEERKALLRASEDKDRLIAELLTRGAPAGTPAQPTLRAFDEVAMEREYVDAVINDERDRAIEIRGQINAHREDLALERYRSMQSVDRTMAALDVVTQQALQEYPWLDTPEGDQVLEMIIALRDRKIQGGVAPHLALSHAVKAIAPAFAPEGEADTGVRVDRRNAVAVARGVADSGRQPPSLRGMGNRSTAGRVDVPAMTEDQFRALPREEVKRLRGDFV